MIVATHIVTPGKFIISCHMMVHLGAFVVGLHSQIHLEPQSALEEFRQQSTCSSVKGGIPNRSKTIMWVGKTW